SGSVDKDCEDAPSLVARLVILKVRQGTAELPAYPGPRGCPLGPGYALGAASPSSGAGRPGRDRPGRLSRRGPEHGDGRPRPAGARRPGGGAATEAGRNG